MCISKPYNKDTGYLKLQGLIPKVPKVAGTVESCRITKASSRLRPNNHINT